MAATQSCSTLRPVLEMTFDNMASKNELLILTMFFFTRRRLNCAKLRNKMFVGSNLATGQKRINVIFITNFHKVLQHIKFYKMFVPTTSLDFLRGYFLGQYLSSQQF